jgi:hypothetical protein
MIARRRAERAAHDLHAVHRFGNHLRQVGITVGVRGAGDVERHTVECEGDVAAVAAGKAAHLDLVGHQALAIVDHRDAGDVAEHVAVSGNRQAVEIAPIEHRGRSRGRFDVLRHARDRHASAFADDLDVLQHLHRWCLRGLLCVARQPMRADHEDQHGMGARGSVSSEVFDVSSHG